jgi:hypothetical protein
MDTRKVNRTQGMIHYLGEGIAISNALGGWNVGLAPQQTGEIEVWFAKLLVGHIDPLTSSFLAIRTAPKGEAHRPIGRFRYAPSANGPVPTSNLNQNL